MINELRRACGPHVEFVLLGSGGEETGPGVTCAGFYDLDKLNRLAFDTAVFHYYGLAYLADGSFLRGRRLIYVVHSVPTTEPWSLLDPYGGNDDVARSFERLCGAADALVCVSEAERGKLLLLYPELAPKTFVIPNGLSSLPEQPVRLRANRSAFGFLGRADYRKGLRELVRAFAGIPGHLRIACGAEDEAYLRDVRADAERLRLTERIRWEGRIGDAEKLPFLQSLDALIVPSRWEPFGYAALEALRAGIPPIVSRQGGLADIVGQDYRYTFEPYRESSIARCIALFQNDSVSTVRETVEQARYRARHLTAERMATAYDAVSSGRKPESPIAVKRTYAGEGGHLPTPTPAYGHASATPKPRD